jgi:hypothetical protein
MVLALTAAQIGDTDLAPTIPRAQFHILRVVPAQTAVQDQAFTDVIKHLDLASIAVGVLDLNEDIRPKVFGKR